jgi:hypothetical protein
MLTLCLTILILIPFLPYKGLILHGLYIYRRSIQCTPLQRGLLAPGGGGSSSSRRDLIVHASSATAKWRKLRTRQVFTETGWHHDPQNALDLVKTKRNCGGEKAI